MYLIWDEKTISDFSEKNINDLYNQGFLFTREGKGKMYETRSVRVDLSKFELSSENRRIIKKTDSLIMEPCPLPMPNYNWEIGKMGKNFYETKFGKNIFTANKIKELLTTQHNFNLLLQYNVIPTEVARLPTPEAQADGGQEGSLRHSLRDSSTRHLDSLRMTGGVAGNAICAQTNELLHYSYPFYDLNSSLENLGIGMMLRAIIYAKEQSKKYVYLGSAKDAKALYKFQFKGVEWWDREKWKQDIDEIKNILK